MLSNFCGLRSEWKIKVSVCFYFRDSGSTFWFVKSSNQKTKISQSILCNWKWKFMVRWKLKTLLHLFTSNLWWDKLKKFTTVLGYWFCEEFLLIYGSGGLFDLLWGFLSINACENRLTVARNRPKVKFCAIFASENL